MAAPTLSHTKYMQMLGRGTRRAKGKKDLLVVDFTFNSDVHALDAVDVFVGEGKEAIGVRVREHKQSEFDIVDMINEVEGELESDPKLRERIQAKVLLEWRRIRGIDWSEVTEEMWRTMTNKEMAEKLNCSIYVIWDRRPKQYPPPKRPVTSAVTEEMWRTMSDKQIAKQIGCGFMTVWRHRPEHISAPRRLLGPIGTKLSTLTEKMWRAYTNEKIAQKFGCSAAVVHTHRPKQWPPPLHDTWQKAKRRRLQMQQRLLTMAAQKKPRPRGRTKIGRALIEATCKSQRGRYDVDFDRKIRRAAPWWWTRVALSKPRKRK